MAIQLVPYNNAMQLGQGFNSYTQQICIDDAVVVDPARAENVVTNDGTTMRIIAEKSTAPSVWSRQPEVVTDDRAAAPLYRHRLERAIEEIEEPQDKTPPTDTEHIGASSAEATDTGSAEATDTGSTEATDADSGSVVAVGSETMDSNVDEPAAAAEERPVAVEMERSDSGEHITRNDLDEKAIAEGKQRSSKPTASQPTTSQATLQRAANKVKANAARKKEEERLQEAARKKEDEDCRKWEIEKFTEQRKYEEEIEKELRADDRIRRSEDRAEQRKIREENRAFEAKRHEDARKAIEDAANLKATSLEDLKKIAAQNQFAATFSGMLENTQQYTFDASGSRGRSQTVTYTSRFVDRLSDVTDDMCISGSLSIKAAKIGGSGKGSFVDSDKFKESDLNFYISVKVVNQTVNFKDALVYNPVDSVTKDDFKQVFGDSFISGFVEGGEFNAIVSMKILNKAKKTDIQAEAKVALTAGPVNLEAQANVGIARSNLETNTETTIQVSWCGGGHIKPMEQQWDIQSLMQAAARFPDLAADCPQRTYAILTKYETLRSYVALKPEGCTPLQYENAQLYTNALLDSFMTYKFLYKRLGEWTFNVQGKTLEILPWPEGKGPTDTKNANKGMKNKETGLYPYVEDNTRFEASTKGLSDARTAIRRQMARIVNEVDLIEQAPKVATDEDHKEPFQSPVAFEARLPTVDIPNRLKHRTHPLTGRAIRAKELTEAEQAEELARDEELSNAPALYNAECKLSQTETAALDLIRNERPGIGLDIRVTGAVGSDTLGKYFNNLEILEPNWVVDSIKFHIYRGFISYAQVTYENGLIIGKGVKHNDAKSLTFGPFNPGERAISASIETGVRSNDQDKQPRVLAVGLFTNRGRSFLATAPTESKGDGKYSKDGVTFEQVEVTHFDEPKLENGTLKGLFGRSDDDSKGEGAIWRLGLIWGRSSVSEATSTESKPLSLSSITSMVADARGPLSGFAFDPTEWKHNVADFICRREIKFNPTYSEPPLMISGLAGLDIPPQTAIHTDVRHVNAVRDKATCVVRTIGSGSGTPLASWLAIPRTDKHIETGVYKFVGDEDSLEGDWPGKKVYIPYSRPFSRAPTIQTWLCEVVTTEGCYSAWCSVPKNSTEGFTMQIHKLPMGGQNFAGIRLGWFAYDSNECPNIQSGIIENSSGRKAGRENFSKEFKTTPAVFVTLRYFEAGSSKNFHVFSRVGLVKEDGFDYDFGTKVPESSHDMKRFGYNWLAIA